jgi:hypothetical protein
LSDNSSDDPATREFWQRLVDSLAPDVRERLERAFRRVLASSPQRTPSPEERLWLWLQQNAEQIAAKEAELKRILSYRLGAGYQDGDPQPERQTGQGGVHATRAQSSPKLERVTQAMTAHTRTGMPLADGTQIQANETLAWLKANKKQLPALYGAGRTTCEAALKRVIEAENGGKPKT